MWLKFFTCVLKSVLAGAAALFVSISYIVDLSIYVKSKSSAAASRGSGSMLRLGIDMNYMSPAPFSEEIESFERFANSHDRLLIMRLSSIAGNLIMVLLLA